MNTSTMSYWLDRERDPTVRHTAFAIARDRYAWPNMILVAAILAFYGGGIVLLATVHSPVAIVLAIALLSQSMIWSSYLAHDCAHQLVSKRRLVNEYLGEMLSLITGITYTPFESYRLDHLRHHSGKIDLLGADLGEIAKRWPWVVTRILLTLEALYIPVFFYVIKWRTIRECIVVGTLGERFRVAGCLVMYGALFHLLLSASAASLAALFAASFVRIHVARFVDTFQHSYDQINPAVPEDKGRTREYELHNTFSLPVARKWVALNSLILNFGFHCAHHVVPSCPWYALPKLDRLLHQASGADHQYGARETGVSLFDLLRSYHRNRVDRIFDTDEGNPYDRDGRFSLREFTGAYTDKLLG